MKSRVRSFGYNKDGAPTTTTFPNGTVATVAYDNADRATSSALTKGATGLGTIGYARDNLGDVTGTTPSSGAPVVGVLIAFWINVTKLGNIQKVMDTIYLRYQEAA